MADDKVEYEYAPYVPCDNPLAMEDIEKITEPIFKSFFTAAPNCRYKLAVFIPAEIRRDKDRMKGEIKDMIVSELDRLGLLSNTKHDKGHILAVLNLKLWEYSKAGDNAELHGVFIKLGDYTEYMDSVCPAFITIPYEDCNQSNGIERIERELGHRMRCAFDHDFREWLAAHGHMELEDNVVVESTTQAGDSQEDSHIELSAEDIGKITEPIVKANFNVVSSKYDFGIYIPACMCKDAQAVNEYVEKALLDNGIDPAALNWKRQKKEYKYDGFFYYIYHGNEKLYPIALFTDSKTQWRTSTRFRMVFDSDFRAWLAEHGMTA